VEKPITIPDRRNPGDKFPKNFVKIAILRYVSDVERSATEIYDYMEVVFNVKETRGIRGHLSWLVDDNYLEKRVKSGIGSYFKWKKTLESFKKIVLFLETNDLSLRKVEIQNAKFIDFDSVKVKVPKRLQKKLKTKELKFPYHLPIGSEMNYLDTLSNFEKPIDIARYWYNTEYTESFLNKKTIAHFLNKSYKLFLKDKEVQSHSKQYHFKMDKHYFRHITFFKYDDEVIVTLLHYSPSLVLHMIDLDNKYKKYAKEPIILRDFVFEMVLKDLEERAFIPLRMPTTIARGFKKVFAKDGRFAGLDMRLVSALENPHDNQAFTMAYDEWPGRVLYKSENNASKPKEKGKSLRTPKRRKLVRRSVETEEEDDE